MTIQSALDIGKDACKISSRHDGKWVVVHPIDPEDPLGSPEVHAPAKTYVSAQALLAGHIAHVAAVNMGFDAETASMVFDLTGRARDRLANLIKTLGAPNADNS